MGQYAPLVIIGALLLVMVFMSNRNKAKRAAADVERRKAIVVGTRVMTTSGMYGTITSVDPANDGSPADSVTLEIAPGVDVQWALAAVREAPERVVAVDPAPPAAETIDHEPTDHGLLQDRASDDAPATGVRMVKPKGRAAER